MLVNIHFQKRPKVATVCVLLILINLRWPKFFLRMVCALGAYYTKVGFPLFPRILKSRIKLFGHVTILKNS